MKTQELFKLLEQNQDKALLFEYAPKQLVGANYHITEVKHITIDSVDCGSQTDFGKKPLSSFGKAQKKLEKPNT